MWIYLRFFKGVREAALVPAPHLSCHFWIMHVSTERYLTGRVSNIDRRPEARRQKQVYVVSSCLSSH